MADKKISELTSAAYLNGTEVFPIVQNGVTLKTTLGAVSGYRTSNFASFANALTSAAGKELIVDSAIAITSDTTPTNVTLRIANGGMLTIASDKTLTINVAFECGLFQCFTCTGTGKVVFGSGAVTEVYPEWWGVTGTNDNVAIQSAINSFKTVKLLDRTYHIGASIYLQNTTGVADPVGWNLIGINSKTIFDNGVPAGESAIVINGGLGINPPSSYWFMYNGLIKDIQIVGDGVTLNDGIRARSIWNWKFENVQCTNHGQYGFLATHNNSFNPDYSAVVLPRFESCIFSNNSSGVILSGDNSLENPTFINCKIENNKKAGFIGNANHTIFQGGSVSFNGTAYTGTYGPDQQYGGISFPYSTYQPKGVRIIGLEMDDNIPQHIWLTKEKGAVIESNVFVSRFHGADINKYTVVIGTDSGPLYCEETILQGNTLGLPTTLVGSGKTHTFVLSKSYGIQGYFGNQAYAVAGGVAGTDLFYIEDIEAPASRNTYFYAMKYALQNASNNIGFVVPYLTGITNQSIADDTAISFKPINDRGYIFITANGAATTSGILLYTVSGGKVFMCAFPTGATSVIDPKTSSTVLTGTTGTDGKISISTDATSGKIYIENRFGSSLSFTLSTAGALGEHY